MKRCCRVTSGVAAASTPCARHESRPFHALLHQAGVEELHSQIPGSLVPLFAHRRPQYELLRRHRAHRKDRRQPGSGFPAFKRPRYSRSDASKCRSRKPGAKALNLGFDRLCSVDRRSVRHVAVAPCRVLPQQARGSGRRTLGCTSRTKRLVRAAAVKRFLLGGSDLLQRAAPRAPFPLDGTHPAAHGIGPGKRPVYLEHSRPRT